MENEKPQTEKVTDVTPVQTKEIEATISFRSTQTKKSLLIKKSSEAGISLTELIDHKLFSEDSLVKNTINALEPLQEVMDDEEKAMLENNLKKANNTILDLTKQITELKASLVDLSMSAPVVAPVAALPIIVETIENDADIKAFYDDFMKSSNEENKINISKQNPYLIYLSENVEIEKFDLKGFIKTCVLYNKHRLENNAFNRLSYHEFLLEYAPKLLTKEIAPVEEIQK